MSDHFIAIPCCGLRAALWRVCLLLVVVLGVAAPVRGQDASSSTLYLKFLDSNSGAAVAPQRLVVDEVETEFQVEAGSLAALQLADGNHVIVVEAENYLPIEFSANVAGSDTAVMEVELDAVEVATPAPVDEGSAVIEGFVTDADTGALLDGVVLTLPDSSLTTTTDASGQYGFTVKVPAASPDSRPAIAMNVSAEGYKPLKMKNLALAAGERRRMPIKLSSLAADADPTAAEEIDEAAPDGPLRTYEWVFDATIR